MARTDNFNNWATDVANSIREMTGKTDLIPAANFDTEIKSIETSEDLSEELETYDNELSEQTISLQDLSLLLDNKTLPSGSATLPDEYTQLLYIESTGTQYIQTDLNTSPFLGFEIDYLIKNPLSATEFGTMFGCRVSPTGQTYQLATFTTNTTTKKGVFLIGTVNSESAVENIRYNAGITPNQREKISYANRVLTRPDGSTFTISSNLSLYTTTTLLIFALQQSTNYIGEHAKMQLYDLKFTYGNTVVRHFTPVRRNSDGEVGLYETVGGKFYTNSGTGAFLYGEIEG